VVFSFCGGGGVMIGDGGLGGFIKEAINDGIVAITQSKLRIISIGKQTTIANITKIDDTQQLRQQTIFAESLDPITN